MTKTLVIERQSPPAPYERERLYKSAGYIVGHTWSGRLGAGTSLGTYLPVSAIDPSTARAIAISRAWAKVNAADVLIFATVGELEETIDSIAGVFRAAITLMSLTKRLDRKFKKGLISPKEYRSKWLEYRYGIRPLMFEVSSYIAAFKSLTSKTIKRQRFGAESTDSNFYNDVVVDPVGQLPGITVSRESSCTVVARAGVLADVTFTPINIFGVDQIFDSAWELIPGSFIADWFFNIGKVISSWTPNVGIHVLASWVRTDVQSFQKNAIIGLRNVPEGDYSNSWSWDGWKSISKIETTREPDPQRPILPRFDLRLDTAKIIDLVAILSQFRR